jgi:hypothetical protein
MIVPINIDLRPLIQKFQVDKEDIKPLVTSMLNSITKNIKMEWMRASNSLGGSRAQYQEGIYIKKVDYNSAIVGLTGWLPNAIEQGISAFDMKVGFEKSNKKTITLKVDKDGNTKSGWYLTIPFRHATPGALGESQAFSGVMPDDIYKLAKNLTEGEHIKKAMLPPTYTQNLGSRPKVTGYDNVVYETYQHKGSIYEGIQKSQKAHHGGYISFRRVSDNSDKNSWIHTGIQARNFLEKAITNSNLDTIKRMEIDKFLNSLGF